MGGWEEGGRERERDGEGRGEREIEREDLLREMDLLNMEVEKSCNG
jgi:hypothetical protein